MAVLAVMRHGESDAGHAKSFAGWGDTALSVQGREQARHAGAALRACGVTFAQFHTSCLQRARATMSIVLHELGLPDAAAESTWLLNERHYGSLQGRTRQDVIDEHGADAVVAWRRSYAARPPPLALDDIRHPCHAQIYRDVPANVLPATESLADAALRVVPWWETRVLPVLLSGQNVLIVAHTASLRGLTRVIEKLDDAAAAEFRVATCAPVFYEFDRDGRLLRKFEPAAGAGARWRKLRSRLKPTRLFPGM
jgi:2,3-bisphosphoglycerate-dependent phosphoglycerate mutase